MNTQAHLLFNYAALAGRRAEPYVALAVLAGAITPDAPMFLFYFWEKIRLMTPEAVIWGERYFDPNWQAFIDTFNSIPLGITGALVGKFVLKNLNMKNTTAVATN